MATATATKKPTASAARKKTLPDAAIAKAKAEIAMLPLSQLEASPLNVRKTGGQSIEDLAASIRAEGLIQNLTVIRQLSTKSKGTNRFEVTAGARRLKALQLLAKRKEIPADYLVPCKIVTLDRAISTSLAENQMREAMHPADQFEAFKRLIDSGKSVEDTAAAFAVTPRVVRQRMKLASVHPTLLQAYREGELDLEAVTAYASSDDPELQLQVYEQLPPHHRDSEYYISELLKAQEISSDHPLVKFVGLEEYRAAGGATHEDLFSEQEGKFFLSDSALLNRLANEKLGKTASKVKKEGWGWVEIKPSFSYYDRREFLELERIQIREATPEQKARLEEIARELPLARAALEALEQEEPPEDDDTGEADYDARWEAANNKVDALEQEQHDIGETLLGIAPGQMAHAGAAVTIEHGRAKVIRNLIKKEDKKAATTAAKTAQAAAGITEPVTITDDDSDDEAPASAPARPEEAGLSQALRQRLTAQHTAALQASLINRTDIALATLTAQLVREVAGKRNYWQRPLGLSFEMPRLHLMDTNIADSQAHQRLATARETLVSEFPAELLEGSDIGPLIRRLAQEPTAYVLSLLTICLAHYVKQNRAPLPQLLQLDMADWWQPTQDSYLKHVAKPLIQAAVEEACDPAEAKAIEPLKKGPAAERAEHLLAGKRWLPALLRTSTTEEPES